MILCRSRRDRETIACVLVAYRSARDRRFVLRPSRLLSWWNVLELRFGTCGAPSAETEHYVGSVTRETCEGNTGIQRRSGVGMRPKTHAAPEPFRTAGIVR